MPAQHGAWGFLALPWVLGIAAAGWSPWLVSLGITWVSAYPASWALTGLLAARRRERFQRAARIWTPMCALAGVPLLLTHPWLGWVLLVYLLLFAVNVDQARARRERSLTNDLVLIAECVLLVPVAAGIVTGAGGPWPPLARMTEAPVVVAALACALALIGSTLHVKSLIRERGNPAFTSLSQKFAAVSPAVMVIGCATTGLSLWLAAPFLLLTFRALCWHNPTWRPARIGLVELAGFLAVAATATLML